MTPHNEAGKHDIAKTVLMPGDPLRAKYIAEHYLKDSKLFNVIRNMYGYTGTYQGKRISVMGSGMGMPSIGIYSYELYRFYDVERIIRVGSAGAYHENLNVFDLFLADSAWSESTFAYVQGGNQEHILYPDALLNQVIETTAASLNMPLHKGRVHSSDVFYHEENVNGYHEFYQQYHCDCVEMESFALFHNAHILNKQAACLLTISDSFVCSEKASAKQRQTAFDDMIHLALEAAFLYESERTL